MSTQKIAKRSPAGRVTANELESSVSAVEDTAARGIEIRIYQAIFDGVLNHRLVPGTRLPELELCELFGAGRAIVRRVLEKLAYDGVVVLRPNKGAVIAQPSLEETRQIFEARRMLEHVLVGLATERATKEDLRALRASLADEHQAVHRMDHPSWTKLASNFHLQIAALARNPILERYLTELVLRCSLIVSIYVTPGQASCEHDEHTKICERIEAGDAQGAISIMADHLYDLEKRLEASLTQGERSLAQMLGIS